VVFPLPERPVMASSVVAPMSRSTSTSTGSARYETHSPRARTTTSLVSAPLVIAAVRPPAR
jgi:hypothetical protein